MRQPIWQPTRRTALRSMIGGSLLFPGIVSELMAAGTNDPLAPRPPQFSAKAKRVIMIYLTGGVSHIDTFDPKPRLTAETGKNKLMGSLWKFQANKKCGTEISDLFPEVRDCLEEICLIRSMKSEHTDHAQCTLGIHTGSVTVTRPSLGAWVSYGLGTENQNLPSFVVLAPHLPYAGSQVWGSDFLPGCHQGTRVVFGDDPVPDLKRRAPSEKVQDLELSLMDKFNHLHQKDRATDPVLAARMKSFETAYGMQREMPEVLDLTKETDATLDLYGLKRGENRGFGWQAIVARRLAERGVRFVELIDTGSGGNWDAHSNMKEHEPLAKKVDRPIAGLLRDLKSRHARRHASDLHNRVRPNSRGRWRGPKSPRAGLFVMACGRGRQGRDRLRKVRRIRPRCHRKSSHLIRLPRHNFAPTRVRSREANLPARWARLSFDGCVREGCEGNSGVVGRPWSASLAFSFSSCTNGPF